jgi:diguanylate cyclase (GGDEF)-like protein
MRRVRMSPAGVVLAGGAVGVVGYVFGPVVLSGPIFMITVLVSIGATVVGAARNQTPGRRWPWWMIAGAEAVFYTAAILRLLVPPDQARTTTLTASVPDLVVIPGYALIGFALVHMLRQRRAGDDDPARADALAIGLGAALVAWIFLIAPAFDSSGVPTVGRALLAFFPIVDVLLLVVVSQLVSADGTRRPALWLVGGATTALFAGDLLYALWFTGVGGSSAWPRLLDALFLVGYVGMAAAALHPSMRTLTEPQQVLSRSQGRLRTASIAAVLAVPSVASTLWPPTSRTDAAVRLGVSVLLTVTVVARIVRANNSRASAEEDARRRATHDALTDLPNRELLADAISRWDDDAEINLLFIDLDRFKMVNDNWGHAVGDELLCAVAGRLSELVRGDDLVCRIGGDEFVVAMISDEPSALAESFARRMLVEFARPFVLSVGEVVVTPSIGVARSNGATEALELIRDADTAMYKAKDSGRNRFAFFDSSLRDRVRTRVDLEQALRGALERGELSVYYQPIIDLATERFSGYEALMRWDHPQLGRVSPLEFIPIAEDTGLIVTSGAWLLEEAAAQLARWRADRPELHVSVNVSVRQLRDDSLVEVVQGVLDRTGLPASALWLEITESCVIEEPDKILAILRELRTLGITLCIDDFGTGYSSLSYLRRFPAGIVKIDRSFVAGLGEDGDAEAIVRTVIAMAHALDQQVVAEGVETAVQRDWLRNLDCDLVQGYLYGAPRPASAWSTSDTVPAG